MYSGEIPEDILHEGRIRTYLDDFFNNSSEGVSLQNALGRAEGMSDMKGYARNVAHKADQFYEEGVFILLGARNDNSDHSLDIIGYADEKIAIAEDCEDLEDYRELIHDRDIEMPELELTQNMPETFRSEIYSLNMEKPQYENLRTSGISVIGPETSWWHDLNRHEDEY